MEFENLELLKDPNLSNCSENSKMKDLSFEKS